MTQVELSACELVTEPCRLAFPHLFEAVLRAKGSDRMTFQAVVLIPPDVSRRPFNAAMKAAMIEEFGKVIKMKPEKNPVRDCMDKEEQFDGYDEEWFYINTHSGFQPAVVDRMAKPIMDQALVYAGMWCRFHLRAFGWDNDVGGKGVSFGLEAIQIVRDDEPFAQRSAATDVFEPLDEVDDDGFGDDDGLDELFG